MRQSLKMQLVVHVGSLFTEEDRLLRTLLNNKGAFAKHGVSVPGPSRYKGLLRDTLNAMADAAPAPDAREVMLDVLLDDERADRIILQQQFLFGAPRSVVRDGLIYWLAPAKTAQLVRLFAGDQIEIFIAMRNPATFLPALFENAPQEDMISFLRGADPFSIRWSDTLAAIRAEAPEVTITAWCFEDMPLIWAQIIREMAGLEHGTKVKGGFDLLSSIMSKEGMKRFRAYLQQHPTINEVQKRRVIAAFLDKFALDDEIELELNAPGWDEEIIDDLTDVYEEDMAEVARIPGVTLITP